jgi:hypothetical protein
MVEESLVSLAISIAVQHDDSQRQQQQQQQEQEQQQGFGNDAASDFEFDFESARSVEVLYRMLSGFLLMLWTVVFWLLIIPENFSCEMSMRLVLLVYGDYDSPLPHCCCETTR